MGATPSAFPKGVAVCFENQIGSLSARWQLELGSVLEEKEGLGQNSVPDPEGRVWGWGGRVTARERCDSGSRMPVLSGSMCLLQWLCCRGGTLLG